MFFGVLANVFSANKSSALKAKKEASPLSSDAVARGSDTELLEKRQEDENKGIGIKRKGGDWVKMKR